MESIYESIFYCVQVLENFVREPLFTDLLPEMLYRIEFRAVGRQGNDPHVLGDLEVLGLVPSSFIHHHEDEIGGTAPRYLIEKQGHGMGIDHGENQRIKNASSR